jgi:hypothetical protein
MGLRSGIGDPGSGKNLFRIPDPGVKRHRIPDPLVKGTYGSGSFYHQAKIVKKNIGSYLKYRGTRVSDPR